MLLLLFVPRDGGELAEAHGALAGYDEEELGRHVADDVGLEERVQPVQVPREAVEALALEDQIVDDVADVDVDGVVADLVEAKG